MSSICLGFNVLSKQAKVCHFVKMEWAQYRAMIRFFSLEAESTMNFHKCLSSVYGKSAPCYVPITSRLCEFRREMEALKTNTILVVKFRREYSSRNRHANWYHSYRRMWTFDDDVIKWKHFPRYSLKQKCRHFDEIFITGCTESCQNDNFRCSQWLKFHQNDNISVSVLGLCVGIHRSPIGQHSSTHKPICHAHSVQSWV